eukprot:m.81233 g.81233  ORF g.81233 m.81233 type:complete len:70 (-) comp12051_c0_seq6:157-366(-)
MRKQRKVTALVLLLLIKYVPWKISWTCMQCQQAINKILFSEKLGKFKDKNSPFTSASQTLLDHTQHECD